MANRAVHIIFISATDLRSVNHFSEIKPYVVAWMKEEGSKKYDKKKSPVDKDNGTNPRWNHRMRFVVDEAALLESRLVVEVEIRTKGALKLRTKEIGHLSIPLREFVTEEEDGGGVVAGEAVRRTYDVLNSSGQLNVSVRIGERTDEPRPQYHENPQQGSTSRVRLGLSTATAVLAGINLAEQDQESDV